MAAAEFWRLGFSRQKQGREEKEEGPLNRFYSNKNAAHQAHLNTAWECNDPFLTTTDTAKMTDDTLLHKGTVQQTDFRLIHPAPRQSCHITRKKNSSTMKQGRVTTQGRQRTRFLHKELESLRKNQDNIAKKRTITQKTRFFPLQMTSKDTMLQDPMNSVPRQAR